MTRVVIGGVEYAYEFGLKAMMLYEGIAEKPYGSENTLTSAIVTHYACLLAANEKFINFAEFVALVKTREVLEALTAALDAELQQWNAINAAVAPSQKKKEKKA